MRKPVRREEGASIYLVIFFAFLLVILAWLGFEYVMMLRGSHQARNTVDAAVLNIAKRSPESRVQCDVLYRDVADSEGKVGLSNINRVWGKHILSMPTSKICATKKSIPMRQSHMQIPPTAWPNG